MHKLIVILTVVLISSFLLGCLASQNMLNKQTISENEILELIRRNETSKVWHILENESHHFTPSELLLLKSKCAEREKKWVLAADYLEQLIKLESNNFEYRVYLLNVYSNFFDDKDSLRELINENSGYLYSSNNDIEQDLVMSYNVLSLLEDTLARTQADRLIELYPENETSISLVGSRFWDGLFPIWESYDKHNAYCDSLLTAYPNSPWALAMWRFKISAYSQLKDTSNVIETSIEYTKLYPDNPFVLNFASSSLFDLNVRLDLVKEWQIKAFQNIEQLNHPKYMSAKEWALYDTFTKASVPTLLAEVYLAEGDFINALKFAEIGMEAAIYDMDDFVTNARQHEILGRINLEIGNYAIAELHFTNALIEGEVRNASPLKAENALKVMNQNHDSIDIAELSRKLHNYNGILFEDVTEAAGLGDINGSRFAWGDFNHDGFEDLLVNGSRLFRNKGNSTFEEISDWAELEKYNCHGGVWGDFNNDGALDLLLFSNSKDINNAERLLIGKGNGTFTDITEHVPALPDSFSTEAAIVGDFNGDGKLDIYIAGYERQYSAANELGNAWEDRLLLQTHSYQFELSNANYGMVNPDNRHYCGRSPVACDFNRNGTLDLYVGNYRLQRNNFWLNNENNGFVDLAEWYMVDGEFNKGYYGHTIGAQWGDVNGDGHFDLIVCNLAHPRYIDFSNKTMLYLFDPEDTSFRDARYQWGIKYEECHSEPLLADFSNNMHLDLFITSVYPQRRSFMYANDGSKFDDVTYLSGTRIFNGWGTASVDFNNDGRLDFITRDDGKIKLFMNVSEPKNYIKVKLMEV